uniref:(northern house mosquito) hypothetical protein n=1 Tax=Culex pipiens TaxID=7175 RepID=A0A8D8EX67_CULPI
MPEISFKNFHRPSSIARFSVPRFADFYLVLTQFCVTFYFLSHSNIHNHPLSTEHNHKSHHKKNPLTFFRCGFPIKQKNLRRACANKEKRRNDRKRMLLLAITR